MKIRYGLAGGLVFILITLFFTASALSQDQPRTPRDFNNLGVADHDAGRFHEAVENYSRAIRINPGYAIGYFNRGVAYQALGKTDLMCRDFAKACEFGDCDGSAWAKENGLCPGMASPVPVSAETMSTPPAETPKPARKPLKKRTTPLKKRQPVEQASEPPGLIVIGAGVAAVLLLLIIPLWIVYRKAGQPGWGCLVPFYNIFLMVRIAGKPWWWFLLMFVPVVNIVFYFLMYLGVAENFGKGFVFGLGLFLLPFIFFPILAYSKAQYQGG